MSLVLVPANATAQNDRYVTTQIPFEFPGGVEPDWTDEQLGVEFDCGLPWELREIPAERLSALRESGAFADLLNQSGLVEHGPLYSTRDSPESRMCFGTRLGRPASLVFVRGADGLIQMITLRWDFEPSAVLAEQDSTLRQRVRSVLQGKYGRDAISTQERNFGAVTADGIFFSDGAGILLLHRPMEGALTLSYQLPGAGDVGSQRDQDEL